MSIRFKIVPVTPFQQNCTIVWCTETNKAAVIDPGGDLHKISAVVEAEGLQLEKILLTHGHADHVAGTEELSRTQDLPIIGPHEADEYWISPLSDICKQYGFPAAQAFTPTTWLNDGDRVQVGALELEVSHTPGHTPGHVVFFHRESKQAWVGDVLFKGSIGRTDFPGGDHDTLLSSIRNKLWALGSDVSFISGHGAISTFAEERASNPFVGDAQFV